MGKSMSAAMSTSSESAFSSREDAEQFLARALPLATAANPGYVSKADKAETRWLTKSIEFDDHPAGKGIRVIMDEEFSEVRAGVSKTGTHEAAFSLGEVRVSPHKDATAITEAGEPALGIIFNCVSPGCIQAKWNGVESSSDWTDIYLQDGAMRVRVLAAFEFLKSGGPKSPS
jgi:hypothetical protein